MKPSLEDLTKLRLLLEVEGIGPGKLFNLLSKFNTLDNLVGSSHRELTQVQGISTNIANKILFKIDEFPQFQSFISKEFEKLEKLDMKWMTYWSDEYPKNLKNIFAPPIILYYKGNLENIDSNSVAIVGTRTASRYGKNISEKFAKDLAKNKITVVSGLARGIDTFAHKGALNEGGRTIAVIGSGLDIIYPAENNQLFEQITSCGAVISEYKLGTNPDAQNFPKRNRIISGISLGTLVVETRKSGGAMQTAAFALEQNREVFSVPGNLGNTQSEGTNMLIQKSEAKLVQNCDDILNELNLKIVPEIGKNIPRPTQDLNMFEEKIYDTLSDNPKHIDLIATESEINSSDCLVHLLSLEFREIIKQLPGKNFIKN